MTLTRRISLIVGVVIGVTAIAIAVLAAFSSRATSLQQVDERLLDLRDAASKGDDPVRVVLQSLDTTPSDLVAYLQIDDEFPISLLNEAGSGVDTPFSPLTGSDLDAAERSPITRSSPQAIRLFALSLGEGQWLIVGESVDEITAQFERQLLSNSLIAIALAIMGALLSAILARGALAPLQNIVDYSGAVASGRLDVGLDDRATSREVRELQTSIGSMVASLQEAAEQKARSEADMRVFLADVAHELRTPLTTVRAYADVLASSEHVDPDVRGRAQERIAQESKRMSHLIDDLLLLARLASTNAGEATSCDVTELLHDHFSDLKVLDSQRPIELGFVENRAECPVTGNRALLERMFANLASNIHRHTPPTARVIVSCHHAGDFVNITVDDAGPGLDDSQLAELAEGPRRFGQIRRSDRHGTGLGLHLVASIARSHGGNASFGRSPLGGLRVTVSLPRPEPRSH